jgi:glyoxylase-like metal-dependent hydrolase (beta-lactamase superfamily II)
VNSFVIDIAGKPVLVDAGAGNTMQPTLGTLHAHLRAMGIAPESIETILLTHLHGDHAYGLVGDDGHTCWWIESAGERLLIWGDIVHLPSVQVPRPHTALVYDVNPALAPQTRARVFDWVARERLRVAGAHLPFPGFATIARQDDGYAFFLVQ